LHDGLVGDESETTMKLPLRIVPANNLKQIKIADATGRFVCSMDFDDLAFAQRIIRRENGWLLTLFGEHRDQHQRDYDQWIAERSHYRAK